MSRFSRAPFALAVAVLSLAPRAARPADDWELLGSRRVSFAAERDVIDLGIREGLFDAIRIDVQEGDIEMYDVRVVFGNGEVWSPNTRVSFRQGSRSRVIDLPGEARILRRVEFSYRSRFRRGRAVVQLFGRRARPAVRPGGMWDEIGTQDVDFHADHDVIRAGREGRFRSVRIVVEGGDVEMYDVKFTFGDGETFSPATRLVFRGGSRSREIDLPGSARVIRRIDFFYRTLLRGGRGRATVHVYGRR